jgi:hypothetical protein
MTPLEAIRSIWRRTVDDPSRTPFDPGLVKQVMQLFPLEVVE